MFLLPGIPTPRLIPSVTPLLHSAPNCLTDYIIIIPVTDYTILTHMCHISTFTCLLAKILYFAFYCFFVGRIYKTPPLKTSCNIRYIFCRSFCIFVQCFHRKAKQFFPFRSARVIRQKLPGPDPTWGSPLCRLIVSLSTDQDSLGERNTLDGFTLVQYIVFQFSTD